MLVSVRLVVVGGGRTVSIGVLKNNKKISIPKINVEDKGAHETVQDLIDENIVINAPWVLMHKVGFVESEDGKEIMLIYKLIADKESSELKGNMVWFGEKDIIENQGNFVENSDKIIQTALSGYGTKISTANRQHASV